MAASSALRRNGTPNVKLSASIAVMFPTAFCAGMTLPLATHALTSRGHGEAAIGRVYGANTAGCILGTYFATHLGMEALGRTTRYYESELELFRIRRGTEEPGTEPFAG